MHLRRLLATAGATALLASSIGTATLAQDDTVDVQEGLKISYLNPFSQDTFWIGALRGAEAGANTVGAEFSGLDAGNDPTTQANQIDTAVAQGADVLVIAPVDSQTILPQIEAAKAEGVTVVSLNRPISGTVLDGTVQIAEVEGGRAAAAQLISALQAAGITDAKILHLQGAVTDEAAQLRGSGFESGLRNLPEGMSIEIIERGTDWNIETAASAVEGVLSQTDIDGIYTESDFLLPGIVPVLERNGYTPAGGDKPLIIVGVGGLPDALQLIRDGWQNATMDFAIDRQAAAAVVMGAYLASGADIATAAQKAIELAPLDPEGAVLNLGAAGPILEMQPVLVTTENASDESLWGNNF